MGWLLSGLAMNKVRAIDKLKQLDAERQALIESVKEEHLQVIDAAIKALAEIGLYYEVIVVSDVAPKTAKQVRTKKGGPCKECKFETLPPHDGRAHRKQNPKAPFSDAELKKLGLKRID